MTLKPLIPAILAIALAHPALAQQNDPAVAETPDFKASGSVTLVSDYRFRGVSQTDKGFAVQGGLTVAHKTGLYAGFWASNLAGWGTFGGPNLELDLFGGYRLPVGNGTLDAGLTWYVYPGGAKKTDFAEPFVKLSGTAGPVSMLAGVAYAPKQQSLGNWYFTGVEYVAGLPNNPGAKHDNLYLWGDISSAVQGTPVTVKAHIGHSNGNPGLGPNGTSIAPTGAYWDWLLGVDYVVGPLTLGVAYVDTDISARDARSLQPNFASTNDGSSIAASKVLFSVTAAF